MLTNTRLVLAQADAIARLARLRVCTRASLTQQGHLSLELSSARAHHWAQDTLGHLGSNVARVLRWEEQHSF
ncbi:MAG: hypothetical protein KF760_21150 [Candidatus Eremiobacteraeota bacterium]|nr:hypothetical protein [Candidatus Eremiobacteraeota bacterium]MCW5867296.1 hypothetical protein [Candidatus Eremiobacteraeota bacterium]